ncbi:MFS transporter [Streptomyces sp. TRM66268-LWL]|uniref:MFS transporter n=1 Tax=Streptomyces polyasparticus TaxID=2767826 RepID=A0ABR7S6D8_9ACTN|nr:MFS transporter [Streptomyces polyasparticus]MBC9711035.1 MFS transporter [Streptomyces polyasparticus]
MAVQTAVGSAVRGKVREATGGRQVPAPLLALLATPIAAGANAPVLILPSTAASLGVSTASVTWIVTAFAWAMAVGTPLFAGLLRLRGLRAALWVSSAFVLAGSALVALAPWLPALLVGRAAQALGGAGFVAVAMSLAAGSARRMGVITSGFGVLGASGPLLGSLIGEAASWRVALLLSAVSLVAVPAVARYAKSAPVKGSSFDVRGAGALVALASALVLIPQTGAAPPVLLAAFAAAVLLVLHVRRRPEGLVPAAVVRSPRFAGAALTALAVSTSYFSLLFALPRLIADRAGWEQSAIGLGQMIALLAGSALSWGLAAVSVRMSRRAVYGVLLTLGALAPLTAVCAAWAPLLLVAATVAVLAATGGNAVLAVYAGQEAPAHQRASAIGLFVLCYQLGGAFGPAIAALLVLG